MRIKTGDQEVFVIENLAADNAACASHQLAIYNFSLDGTVPPGGPDAALAAGVIDVTFWEVTSADATAQSQALTGLVSRFPGEPTVPGKPDAAPPNGQGIDDRRIFRSTTSWPLRSREQW